MTDIDPTEQTYAGLDWVGQSTITEADLARLAKLAFRERLLFRVIIGVYGLFTMIFSWWVGLLCLAVLNFVVLPLAFRLFFGPPPVPGDIVVRFGGDRAYFHGSEWIARHMHDDKTVVDIVARTGQVLSVDGESVSSFGVRTRAGDQTFATLPSAPSTF